MGYGEPDAVARGEANPDRVRELVFDYLMLSGVRLLKICRNPNRFFF